MKKIILGMFLLTAPLASVAAPTHHEFAEGLAKITDANNEADGKREFLVCFYQDRANFSGPADDRYKQLYKVAVLRRVKERQILDATAYSVAVGPYWVVDSVVRLGREEVKESSCKGRPDITFSLTEK